MKSKNKPESKLTSGTKEWAWTNVNCYRGCSNNCGYCYSKKQSIRYKRINDPSEWSNMVPNMKAINKGYGKRRNPHPEIYDIMFPSSHDITRESLENCLIVLEKLLKAGNTVLIVSKPNFFCISNIILKLERFKDQFEFRFTITSLHDEVLKEWEPNAPRFDDRFNCLSLADNLDYKTSVSIEPFLDMDPIPLIKKLALHCSSIWFGKLNYQKTEFNSWSNIRTVINNLKLLPDNIKNKIRLKDSIMNLYKKKGLDIPDLLCSNNKKMIKNKWIPIKPCSECRHYSKQHCDYYDEFISIKEAYTPMVRTCFERREAPSL